MVRGEVLNDIQRTAGNEFRTVVCRNRPSHLFNIFFASLNLQMF